MAKRSGLATGLIVCMLFACGLAAANDEDASTSVSSGTAGESDAFGQGAVGASSLYGSGNRNMANAGGLYDRVLNDSLVDDAVKQNLSAGIEAAALVATEDADKGRIAATQVFGGYANRSGEAARENANRFNAGLRNRLNVLHNAAASPAAGSAGSPDALASVCYPEDGYEYHVEEGVDRIWLGGFGSWSRQKDRNDEYGYKYDTQGIIMGYDWRLGDISVGFSGAYSSGDLKNNEGYTRTDVEMINLGMYLSYDPGCGIFADANIGYGHSWNRTRTNLVTGGGKSGKYSNHSLQAGVNVGYAFDVDVVDGLRVVPTVGVQYTRVHQSGWSEATSHSSLIGNWFDDTNDDYVEIPIGVRVSRTFCFNNGVGLTPEARAAWIYQAKGSGSTIRMGYAGSAETTTLYGVDPGRGRGLVGAGLKANINPNVDAFVDYNYEWRSGFHNSNVMTGMGISF